MQCSGSYGSYQAITNESLEVLELFTAYNLCAKFVVWSCGSILWQSIMIAHIRSLCDGRAVHASSVPRTCVLLQNEPFISPSRSLECGSRNYRDAPECRELGSVRSLHSSSDSCLMFILHICSSVRWNPGAYQPFTVQFLTYTLPQISCRRNSLSCPVIFSNFLVI